MIPKNTLFPYFCTRDVAGGAEFCKLRSDIAEIKKLNKGRMFLVCFSFAVDFYLDPKIASSVVLLNIYMYATTRYLPSLKICLGKLV